MKIRTTLENIKELKNLYFLNMVCMSLFEGGIQLKQITRCPIYSQQLRQENSEH